VLLDVVLADVLHHIDAARLQALPQHLRQHTTFPDECGGAASPLNDPCNLCMHA
jgi:hypothetical protein